MHTTAQLVTLQTAAKLIDAPNLKSARKTLERLSVPVRRLSPRKCYVDHAELCAGIERFKKGSRGGAETQRKTDAAMKGEAK